MSKKFHIPKYKVKKLSYLIKDQVIEDIEIPSGFTWDVDQTLLIFIRRLLWKFIDENNGIPQKYLDMFDGEDQEEKAVRQFNHEILNLTFKINILLKSDCLSLEEYRQKINEVLDDLKVLLPDLWW